MRSLFSWFSVHLLSQVSCAEVKICRLLLCIESIINHSIVQELSHSLLFSHFEAPPLLRSIESKFYFALEKGIELIDSHFFWYQCLSPLRSYFLAFFFLAFSSFFVSCYDQRDHSCVLPCMHYAVLRVSQSSSFECMYKLPAAFSNRLYHQSLRLLFVLFLYRFVSFEFD